MNHSYFASLLENYRRRMDMDTSLLSLRKALHESYQNESFKLKERQRQSMARERREQMENDRILRNRMKEIEEKEKEITQRYQYLRNWRAKARRKAAAVFLAESNQFTGYGWMKEEHTTTGRGNDHGVALAQVLSSTKLNHDREKNSNLTDTESLKPRGEGAEQRQKRKMSVTLPYFVSTRTKCTDHKSSQELSWSKLFNDESHGDFKQDSPRDSYPSIGQRRKCREPAKPKRSTRIESNGDLRQGYKREETPTPNTPFHSDFAKELIEYYKNGGGSTNEEKILESGNTTSIPSCTLKFGKRSKRIGKRGPFNMSALKPDYDILVIDHEAEDNI